MANVPAATHQGNLPVRHAHPSAPLYAKIPAIVLIAGGIFAFLIFPLFGAIGILPLHAYVFGAIAIGGVVSIVAGSILLGKCTPKVEIPPNLNRALTT